MGKTQKVQRSCTISNKPCFAIHREQARDQTSYSLILHSTRRKQLASYRLTQHMLARSLTQKFGCLAQAFSVAETTGNGSTATTNDQENNKTFQDLRCLWTLANEGYRCCRDPKQQQQRVQVPTESAWFYIACGAVLSHQQHIGYCAPGFHFCSK